MPNDDKRRREAQSWLKEFGVKGGTSGTLDDGKAAKDKKKTGEIKAVTAGKKK
jgi:hypothetical protein